MKHHGKKTRHRDHLAGPFRKSDMYSLTDKAFVSYTQRALDRSTTRHTTDKNGKDTLGKCTVRVYDSKNYASDSNFDSDNLGINSVNKKLPNPEPIVNKGQTQSKKRKIYKAQKKKREKERVKENKREKEKEKEKEKEIKNLDYQPKAAENYDDKQRFSEEGTGDTEDKLKHKYRVEEQEKDKHINQIQEDCKQQKHQETATKTEKKQKKEKQKQKKQKTQASSTHDDRKENHQELFNFTKTDNLLLEILKKRRMALDIEYEKILENINIIEENNKNIKQDEDFEKRNSCSNISETNEENQSDSFHHHDHDVAADVNEKKNNYHIENPSPSSPFPSSPSSPSSVFPALPKVFDSEQQKEKEKGLETEKRPLEIISMFSSLFKGIKRKLCSR